MATLAELVTLFSDSGLRNRITAAAIIKAQTVLIDANAPTARRAWAETCLSNTAGTVEMLFKYVLAASRAASLAAITGATDEVVQAAVNSAIDAVYPAEVA